MCKAFLAPKRGTDIITVSCQPPPILSRIPSLCNIIILSVNWIHNHPPGEACKYRLAITFGASHWQIGHNAEKERLSGKELGGPATFWMKVYELYTPSWSLVSALCSLTFSKINWEPGWTPCTPHSCTLSRGGLLLVCCSHYFSPFYVL